MSMEALTPPHGSAHVTRYADRGFGPDQCAASYHAATPQFAPDDAGITPPRSPEKGDGSLDDETTLPFNTLWPTFRPPRSPSPVLSPHGGAGSECSLVEVSANLHTLPPISAGADALAPLAGGAPPDAALALGPPQPTLSFWPCRVF